MQKCPTVAHAALVIPRVPQELVVGGQNPGERQKGAQGGDAYRESQRNQKMSTNYESFVVSGEVSICLSKKE